LTILHSTFCVHHFASFSQFHAPGSKLHALPFVIYQFIPNAPVRVMERLIRSMLPGTMAILDLEDGYLDVRDPDRTSARREGGRKQLLELCARSQGRTNGRPVAMRINVAGTEDFVRDLPVVRAFGCLRLAAFSTGRGRFGAPRRVALKTGQ
jgi:hypothetical protein